MRFEVDLFTATIRGSRASIALALALGSCGPSVDDKQTEVLVQLDQRVSNLEAATESQPALNETSSSTRPSSAEDFLNIANNLARERDAKSKEFLADQKLRNIEERLDRLEQKQREAEMREMARGMR
jgi:hypothetical protein